MACGECSRYHGVYGGGDVAVEPFGSDKGYFGTIIILVKLYNHNYSTFEYS